MPSRFLKVIACEIAFREICHVAARSPSLIDLEFLPQGLHDTPCAGGQELQRRLDGTPPGRYDAVLVGYGLCGNLTRGLRARHTPVVLPRAHDCITLFLGSKETYRRRAEERAGAYYYTSGWLECLRRRGQPGAPTKAQFLPSVAGAGGDTSTLLAEWTRKYGEEEARYLLGMMDDWTSHYTHGALIDFEFARPLELDRQVKDLCASRGWEYERVSGDLGLLQRWVDGEWGETEFLVLQPGERVAPAYDERIVMAETAA